MPTTLRDPLTHRDVVLRLPNPNRVTLRATAQLESAVRDLCTAGMHTPTQQDLDEWFEREPARVLAGLTWLIVAWAQIVEVRTGDATAAIIASLDYEGPERRATTDAERRLWDALNRAIRADAAATLLAAYESTDPIDAASAESTTATQALLHHTLLLLTALAARLERSDIVPWGFARAVQEIRDAGGGVIDVGAWARDGA